MTATTPAPRRPGLAYAMAVLGAFLIVAALVWTMRRYAQPPPLDAARAAERAKTLAELRGAEKQASTTTGWLDQGKGIVRLCIEDAMNIIEREWPKDPAGTRSNLLERVAKATAVPPKPPEEPSPYE
jgi:hypothetical protein